MIRAVATAVLGLSAPTLLPRHHAPAVCALPRATFCTVGRALPVVMNTEDAPAAASFDPDEAIGKQSTSAEQSKKKLSAKQVENTKAYFVNQKLEKARDTETILKLSTDEDLTPVNVATALHVLAKINKVRRAGRDALLRVPSVRGRIVKINGEPALKSNVAPEAQWALRGDRGLRQH